MNRLNAKVQQLLDGTSLRPQLVDGSNSTTTHNLSQHIISRDASSLIRLLGRNGCHDAMLEFCRRYCRDIIDASIEVSAYPGQPSVSRSNADEAVLFAYTAAIAACSKPPLASTLVVNRSYNSKYRTRSFLLSLLDEMENGYGETIRPNSYTLSAVLLGIDGGTDARQILDSFENKYGEDVSDEANNTTTSEKILTVQVYNVAISACGRRSSKESNKGGFKGIEGWQQALSILQTMRRQGPIPNEQTYTAVFHAMADSGKIKVAISLLDELRKSSLVDISSKLFLPLLKACAKASSANMAQTMLKYMKEDSLEITTEHMNLFLLALANCKMNVRALGVLKEMIHSQKEDPLAGPNLVTLNTVLLACANADDYEACYALFEQMKEGAYLMIDESQTKLIEIRPDVVSYNTVISCSDPETALELVNEMRLTRRNRIGIVLPNAVTYTNAITRCRNAVDDDTDTDPEVRQYIFEIALALFDLARDNTLDGKETDLNVYVYSSLIWCAEAVGNYAVAVQLLRDMKCPPNNICYDGVISALSQSGLHRETLYFYYEMKGLNLPATRKTYQKLAYAINNSRDSELFFSPRKKAALMDGVLSGMSDRDRSVNIGGSLFQSLIRHHGDQSEPGASYRAARIVFDSIIGPVDDQNLSAMLLVCSSAKPKSLWEEAVTLLHSSDIVWDAFGPGHISIRALSYAVIACAKADQWEEALNLIELYGNPTLSTEHRYR